MTTIKIKNRQLLNQISLFKDQLKAEIKKDKVELKDQARSDLLSEDGINRQITIFNGKHKLNDQVKTKLTTFEFNLETAKNYFGDALKESDIITSLKKFGYRIIAKKGGRMTLQIPIFREDVTSESDILEDAMLFNLKKFKAADKFEIKTSCQNQEDIFERIIARKLVSFGFKELSLPLYEGIAENPIGREELLRSALLPSLLQHEKSQQHLKYPHKLFEIGLVAGQDQKCKKLSLLISDHIADFNELYSIINLFYAGHGLSLVARKFNCYKKGASFEIILDKNKVGTIGILSERYKDKFKIKKMCICAELEIDDYYEYKNS